ncbi:hypothetical protein NPIL_67881 [Nephila pilipes]|uniref:Uncharacterized protein n=1 Tax=Nephila pilipes TaxID=299642 RepID=A0A8X6PJX1_NEPPI|nr:hypothetical protein NPIL_67881 [Nephila pilipes]
MHVSGDRQPRNRKKERWGGSELTEEPHRRQCFLAQKPLPLPDHGAAGWRSKPLSAGAASTSGGSVKTAEGRQAGDVLRETPEKQATSGPTTGRQDGHRFFLEIV